MRTCVGMGAVAACLAVMCLGCQPGAAEKPQQPAGQAGTGASGQPAPRSGTTGRKSAKAAPKVEEPPPPPTIPKVELSQTYLDTCLVRVGDAMPEAELPDLQGNTAAPKALYGQKLTVVCFWAGGNSKYGELAAVDLLQDLEKEIFAPYVEKGVQAIGINVKETPQTAAPLISQAGAKFPNLLDPQGVLFGKVATEKIPRVYLLDPTGKILWFDVEYSRSTRRQLLQAIRVVLDEI